MLFFRSLMLRLLQVCFHLLLLAAFSFLTCSLRYFLCHVFRFLFWRRFFLQCLRFRGIFLRARILDIDVFFFLFVFNVPYRPRVFCFPSWHGCPFPSVLIKKIAMNICGRFPCGSCRRPQRPSHFSSIFSWSECSQFVFLFVLEKRGTSV